MTILAIILCGASGYLLIAAVWPRQRASASQLLLKLSLSMGFGLGIFSAEFFLLRLLGLTRSIGIDLSLLALLTIVYVLRCSRSIFATAGPAYRDFDPPSWLRGMVTASFVVAVLAAIYSAVRRSIAHPHGEGWDAFAIWNLHARFLFLGGAAHWRDGFSALIPWSHPDYPLLLPAATAHFWSYVGTDDPAVPAIIGIVFTFITLTLLVSSLALLRGAIAAMLAGVALSSTPFFIEQGTSQYADVPLSFFMLASVVLLHHGYQQPRESRENQRGLMALAGLAAGFAAWTKNEGLLFFLALVIAQLWAWARRPLPSATNQRSRQDGRPLRPFLLGAAPMLAVIAWFRYSVGGPGDLSSSPLTMLYKILTPSRYWTILRWYAKEFFRFGSWWIVPGTVAMLAFYVLISRTEHRDPSPIFRASVLTFALTIAGYFAIYVITPRDLYWHLRFSLNRLFLQVWPAAIFLFFVSGGRQELAIPSSN